MSGQKTITISSKIYEHIVAHANQVQRDVTDVVNEALSQAFISKEPSINPAWEQMLQEVKAYQQLHPQLVKDYLNQFVAIHQGELVDHDIDKDVLFLRVKENFPDQVVLQRQVLTDPESFSHSVAGWN